MDYLSHNIAVNLKRIRLSRGMSLDLVSEQTGVSKSMLAQIEKDRANPSLNVVGKIASGLRVKVEELLGTLPLSSSLVHLEDLVPTKEAEGKYRVWTCFPYEDNQVFEIYRIEIEPGFSYVSGGHGEKTLEYVFVLEGELVIESGEESHRLTPEDMFRFGTEQNHRYCNQGDQKVILLCVFMDLNRR